MVLPNLDRYQKDLDSLLSKGKGLHLAMQRDCFPEQMERAAKERFGDGASDFLKDLPAFAEEYQSWYSEAKALIRQLLPDRLSDFVRHYEKLKARKGITFESKQKFTRAAGALAGAGPRGAPGAGMRQPPRESVQEGTWHR